MFDACRVDSSVCDALAGGLRGAGTALTEMDLGPGVPDGGALTAIMGGLLDKFVGDVAELIVGVDAAAEAVMSADARFTEHERGLRAALTSLS